MEYSPLYLFDEVVDAKMRLVIFSNNFKRRVLPVCFLCCSLEDEGQG